MIKDAVSPLEPRYEDLAGDGFGRKARRHFLATRPKFLTASVLPVLVGTAWGATVAGGLELGVALLALLATALVHCASNVINDVGDDITGTDRDNVDYIHPYTGGSRFITNGIMSVQEMHRWGWILIGMACGARPRPRAAERPDRHRARARGHRHRVAVFRARGAAERQGRRRSSS